jgi:hypothetical protein
MRLTFRYKRFYVFWLILLLVSLVLFITPHPTHAVETTDKPNNFISYSPSGGSRNEVRWYHAWYCYSPPGSRDFRWTLFSWYSVFYYDQAGNFLYAETSPMSEVYRGSPC